MATLSIGGHNITLTVTDSHMATATATVHVDVVDTTPPVLALPGNLTVNATGPLGAIVTYSASANDLVDLSRPVNCAPPSGSMFAIGTTNVKCSTSDTRGNTATGSFTVVVKEAADQIKDLITLVKVSAFHRGLRVISCRSCRPHGSCEQWQIGRVREVERFHRHRQCTGGKGHYAGAGGGVDCQCDTNQSGPRLPVTTSRPIART